MAGLGLLARLVMSVRLFVPVVLVNVLARLVAAVALLRRLLKLPLRF